MLRELTPDRGRCRLASIAVLALVIACLSSGAAWADAGGDELTWEFRQELLQPVDEWGQEFRKEKNDDGESFKRVSYSRHPKKLDDSTYQVTAHVNIALDDRQVTERYTLTLAKQNNAWEVAESELSDTVTLLFRGVSGECYEFDKLVFDREGLKLSASNGDVCEVYVKGQVGQFLVRSDDLGYSYEPPAHATRLPEGREYRASHRLYKEIHAKDLEIDPRLFIFSCDPQTCEELLNETFPGLQRVPADQRDTEKYDLDDPAMPPWLKHFLAEFEKERRKDPFHGFAPLDQEGNRHYSVFLSRELDDPESGLALNYNNWGGFEVTFASWPKRWDISDQLAGPLYGYFTEETLRNSDLYELQRREGGYERFLEVNSIRGEVDLAVETPELLRADVEYGLTLKEDTELLPFFISTSDPSAGPNSRRPAPFSVDSVRLEGEELTWVQFGRDSGLAVLPKPIQAGTRINLGLSYSARAIYRATHSYSIVDRHSWLPFTRLGDYIEEYDLIIRSPAKYEIYGSGKRVEERVKGDVRITRWTAEKPVNGPSVIFGKYVSSAGNIEAKTLDGKVIPVAVHVDTANASDWEITEADLGPIANAAINSINLYQKISGIEFPFDELHLVNDPQGLLHGEARSGIVYLGQGVFKSDAELAPYFPDAASISRFIRSVVSHEVGHMWWGGAITFLNSRNWWFIETMPEYFSGLYLEFAFGYDDYLGKVDEWRRNVLDSKLKGSCQNANSLFVGEQGGGMTRNARQAAIYDKGPYTLHMLREIFKGEGPRGPDGADQKFFAFLKQFCQDLHEKGQVVTLDLRQAAESGLGGVGPDGNPYTVDLGWFFDQWIYGAGMPQYALEYDIRQAESGNWIIEGAVRQRVLLGDTEYVLEDAVYRGVVDLTVKAKGGDYVKRLVINDAVTPIQLQVPNRPLEVELNQHGEMLAHDTLYNQGW
jgi:hypothetical protein